MSLGSEGFADGRGRFFLRGPQATTQAGDQATFLMGGATASQVCGGQTVLLQEAGRAGGGEGLLDPERMTIRQAKMEG